MKAFMYSVGLFLLVGAAGKSDSGAELWIVVCEIVAAAFVLLGAWLWDNPIFAKRKGRRSDQFKKAR